MADWGDDEEDTWDAEELSVLEEKALASRQQATASTAPCGRAAAQSQAAAAPKQGASAGGLPRNATDLRRCVQHFGLLPPPPLVASQTSCPGVYDRGCGGTLQLICWSPNQQFWACSVRSCAYREYPQPRKLTPQLTITLERHRGRVQVAAMPGAEDAVRFCGGVRAVLCATGVDLRRALPQAALAPDPAAPKHAQPSVCGPAHATVAAAGQATAETEQGPAPGPAVAAEPTREANSGKAAVADTQHVSNAATVSHTATSLQPSAAPVVAKLAARLQPVMFPLREYEALSSHLVRFGQQWGLAVLPSAGQIPQPTLKAARGTWKARPSAAEVAARYLRMPPSLERALLPFQRQGVRFGLEQGGRCLIADEMGVGKTLQAIALASCFQEEWPLLIVVPASLRLVWAEELEKWLPHLRPSCIHVIEGKEGRVARGSLPLVCITSYEMMQRLTCEACKGKVQAQPSMCAGARPPCSDLQNCMASQRWKVVVIDESHTLRTANRPVDAAHTEAVVAAAKLARRAILLTGTPSLSRPFDLFRQVDAVVPGLLGTSRTAFASAYCNRREVPFMGPGGDQLQRFDVGGLTRGGELHDLLKAEVMLRRLKSDVLSQLPPKRRQVIRLPKPPASEWPKLPAGARQHADDSEGSASSCDEEEDGDGEAAAGGAQPAKHMSSIQRTGLAKASSVVEWLMTALGARKSSKRGGQHGTAAHGDDEDAAGGCGGGGAVDGTGPKVLVFAHHRGVMNRLAAALEGTWAYVPVSYVRIDGSTDAEDRRLAVRRFHSDASVRVALLSVTAAGVGLDFSAASVVVFAELPDEVAHVRQAEDRAHRQGQRQPVNIYFLCAKGTTDDRRWQHLNRSLARVAAVHDGAGLTPPAAVGPTAGQESGVAQRGGYNAAAAGGAAAVAAQAGLEVVCVQDAEEAGITPGAARAGGWAPDSSIAAPGGAGGGSRRESFDGTQTGESPLPPAAVAFMARAVATAARAAAELPAAAEAGALHGATQVAATPASPAGSCQAVTAAVVGGHAVASPAECGSSQQQPEHRITPSTVASPVAQAPATSFVPATASPPRSGLCQGTTDCGVMLAVDSGPAAALQPGAASTAMAVASVPQVAVTTNQVASALRAAPSTAAALQAATPVPVAVSASNDVSVAVAPALAQPDMEADERLQVWFEVSGNTNRVHLHTAADGSAPLLLSLPMEALLVGDSPALDELLDAVGAHRQQGRGQQQQEREGGAPTPGMQQPQQRAAPAVVGGIGVLALDCQLGRARLAAMLAEAREFAAEWRELRGLHQSRLQGKIVRLPLQEAVDEVDRSAAAAGRLGTSSTRFVTADRSDLPLPDGASWRSVTVVFKRWGRESSYQQPFMPDGSRLCINCAKPVPGEVAAQPPEAVLDSMVRLFCGGQCEGWYALKSNGSAYRRALFKLERGVCVHCRLDCHALVKRLQAVEKGSRGWEEKRRRIVEAGAPRLVARGYKAYLDQLVKRAVEGNAWQADHIVPVYKGGGLCDVDNLRTLCVACHADVTKQQVKERAAARKQRQDDEGWLQGARSASKSPVIRRRPKLQRLIASVSSSDDDAEGRGSRVQRGAAAQAAGAQPAPAARSTRPAAARGAQAAAAQPGKPPVRRRRVALQPLLGDSDAEEPVAAEATGGGPQLSTAGPAPEGVHAPSCSAPTSRADAASTARQPLTSQATNSKHSDGGAAIAASKKRSHSALGAAEGGAAGASSRANSRVSRRGLRAEDKAVPDTGEW